MIKAGGLWRHHDFVRLWLGQTVGQFGNQITLLALPIIAISTLHISVFQVGLLSGVEFLPYPVLGLFVGVWVDRFKRRPILILCNLGRLVTLLTIPVAYIYGFLNLYQIFAVAGINGAIAVFYDVAYQSYLPSIVDSNQLVEGNSKLQVSASAATVTGPSIAGTLIGLLGAAISVVGDALGYLISVATIMSISRAERMPQNPRAGRGGDRFLYQLKEGVDSIVRVPVFAAITGCSAMANFGNIVAQSVYLYFAVNALGLTPVWIGVVGSAGGVGLLVGSLFATRVSERFGIGRALTFSIVAGFGWLGYPLALKFPAVPILMIFAFLSSVGGIIFNIVALSFIQRVTPNRLLGRMTATRKTFSRGGLPVGAVVGGVLGGAVGLPMTLVAGGLIAGASVLWIAFSPIRTMTEEEVASLTRAIESSTRMHSTPPKSG